MPAGASLAAYGRLVRVLGFGTYDTATHPRMGILLEGLRAAGDSVLEINEPLGLDTAARVALLRQPWRLPLLAGRLAGRWAALIRRVRRSRRRGTAAPDVVLVGYLGHFDVLLARWLYRRTPIALDHLISAADTARDRGVAGWLTGRLLTWLDGAALATADLVVVDTTEHVGLLPAARRAKAVVVAVGAPSAWSAGPRPAASAAPLRVVFFGLYTPLQGAPVVGAALGLLADCPGVTALMVGGGQDRARAQAAASANPRVLWRDWVPPAELPAIVRGADVCLGIFGTSPKARRVVPNKVFQGAAAGCAIITSDTVPQRRLLGSAAVRIPPGDPVALAAALRGLSADPARLRSLQQAAAALADRAFRPSVVVVPFRQRLIGLVEQAAQS